jgi:hypothetical protein
MYAILMLNRTQHSSLTLMVAPASDVRSGLQGQMDSFPAPLVSETLNHMSARGSTILLEAFVSPCSQLRG